jgi:hypothetical protein
MIQNLFADVVEKKGVIDRRVSHAVIGTIIAAMKAKFLNFLVVRIPEPDLLTLHFHNIFRSLIYLLVVEGSHSHCNLNAICHLARIIT